MTNREITDFQALAFLRNKPHTMDKTIKDDSELAAALVFIALVDAGYVRCIRVVGSGPTYAITDKGREKLTQFAEQYAGGK